MKIKIAIPSLTRWETLVKNPLLEHAHVGMAHTRTQEAIDECISYLQRKWGRNIVQSLPGRRSTGQGVMVSTQ